MDTGLDKNNCLLSRLLIERRVTMKRFTSLKVAPATTFALLFLPSQVIAPAYLDPGTGSLIIQVLIGAIFGGLVVAKIFWNRIKIFFRGLLSRNPKG